MPHLSIENSSSDGRSAIRVKGTLEDAKVPGRFRLRTESGCARARQLDTMTTGTRFTFGMTEAELADAFACVIDAEAGDDMLPSISVTPDADVITASPVLSVDSFSVASVDLEPGGGETVRIAVLSTEAVKAASLTGAGSTIAGLASSDEDGTRITFEVPSQAWARAIIRGTTVDVVVTSTAGERALTLHPTARVELVEEHEEDEEHEDCN